MRAVAAPATVGVLSLESITLCNTPPPSVRSAERERERKNFESESEPTKTKKKNKRTPLPSRMPENKRRNIHKH